MDSLQWIGAIREQTAIKNITIIHKSHDLYHGPSNNVLWSEKLHVCKKQIHQDVTSESKSLRQNSSKSQTKSYSDTINISHIISLLL